MESTRIYKLLSTLKVPTLNRFQKFMHSPYFNVNQKLVLLSDILINDIKQKSAVEDKDQLWKKIGFEDKYNDLKFRKKCNDLVERFEKFVTLEELHENKMLSANLLLDSIKKNGYSVLGEKIIQKTSTLFDRILDNSSEYYLQKYNYEKNLQSLKSNYEKKEDIKNYLQIESYGKLSKNLEIYYIVEKLRFSIDVITWSKQYKIENKNSLPNIERLIKEIDLDQFTGVKVYYLIFQILTIEDSQDKYFTLKKLARKEIYKFPKNEQLEIFDALFSYCIKHVNKNNTPFLHEYLDLNDWGINEELTLKNRELSPTSFRNYVVIGLRVGEFDRVEKYITNNIHLLEDNRRENALNFNLARVAWYKKEYNKVLTYLNLVNYDDIWYNINSKNYLIVVYYELDEYDVLDSTIESFTAFLRREKSLNESYRNMHLNFVKFAKTLSRLDKENRKKVIELKDKITVEKNVSNKPWLLEKIDELLAKK